MQTFARISPNKIGQPSKLNFGIQALQALGVTFGDRMRAEVVNEVLILAPDSDGPHVIRAFRREANGRGMSPHLSLGSLLSAHQGDQPYARTPLAAEVTDGALHVSLRHALTEEEYRWRRWGSYTRQDMPMSGEGVLHLSQQRTENVIVPLSPALMAELRAEADRMRLTLPAYMAHVLGSLDRTVAPVPVVSDWRSAGHQVRAARERGVPLTVAQMIERGIPPASDREWLTAQVQAGRSYAELAREYGGTPKAYSKWGREFGLKPDRLALARKARYGS